MVGLCSVGLFLAGAADGHAAGRYESCQDASAGEAAHTRGLNQAKKRYKKSKDPGWLVWVSRCELALGDARGALATVERALAHAGLTAAQRPPAEEFAAQLRDKLAPPEPKPADPVVERSSEGTVEIQVTGSARLPVDIFVDGSQVGQMTALGKVMKKHQPGPILVRCVDAAGAKVSVRTTVTEVGTVAAPCVFIGGPDEGRGMNVPAVVFLTTGAVALATGIGLLIHAFVTRDEANRLQRACDSCELQSGLGYGVGGLGIAALITGGVLLATE